MTSKFRGPFLLSELVRACGGSLQGPDQTIAAFAPIEQAHSGHLCFLANPKYLKALQQTQASAVILHPDVRSAWSGSAIVTESPYLYFAHALAWAYPAVPVRPQVHPSATIDPSATLSDSAHIGPQVVVGAGAHIGPGVVLMAGCVVGEGCVIGADSVLHPRVVLYHGVTLGARVIIHSGAVLGADGFGFAPSPEGWVKIPQVGQVVIEDDVEIGANTTIDRGALNATRIGRGSKLDNQIQIGHNVQVGERTVIAGCTGIAGSTHIGSDCQIGGGVGMAGHLTIADRVIIGGGTQVYRSIEAASHVAGLFPMSTYQEWLKLGVLTRRLPELQETLREQGKRLAQLEGKT